MFPTDYEKQNPLTRNKAMIKYFKKLERMKLIDKYQSDYLIKNATNESIMDNYYKTSKNTENILNSYEFQRQFLKLKKKYKFIKKIRQRKILLSQNDSDNESENEKDKENNTNNTITEEKGENEENTIKSLNSMQEVPLKDNDNISNYNILNNNNKYDVKALIDQNKTAKNRASQYMRATLFQQIKNEGIYDESEEEKEDDSFESDINSNNLMLNNRKENFEFSLISNEKKKKKYSGENNKKKYRNESDLYDKKSDLSLYSIKTDFKDKKNQKKYANIINTFNYDNS